MQGRFPKYATEKDTNGSSKSPQITKPAYAGFFYGCSEAVRMNTNRIYSSVIVKSVDEDAREIKGIASTPSTDRSGDIVEPAGAKFSLPMPFLWQHQHDSPIGSIVSAKQTKAGIEIVAKLVAPTEDMPSQLVARLQEAWASIKSGLVRGLSIGFRPMEYAFIDDGGIRFTKYEIFEISAVTIPANGDASITSIKSLDQKQRAALGEKLLPVVRALPAGASASVNKSIKNPKPQEGREMKTIAEQIAEFKQTRQAKSVEMEGIMTKSAEQGTTLDAEESEQFDTLQAEIESIDKHISRLLTMQKAQADNAKPVSEDPRGEKSLEMTSGLQVRAKNTQKLEPGIAFARAAKSGDKGCCCTGYDH